MHKRTARRLALGVTCLSLFVGCGVESTEAKQAEVASSQSELTLPPGLDVFAPTWEMPGHDALAHHNNALEFRLRKRTVDKLAVEWTFDKTSAGHDIGPIHATPVVTRDTLYVGSNFGRFYAVNLDGTLRWHFTTLPANPLMAAIAKPSPVGGVVPQVYGTPIVGGAVYSERENIVVFGDLDGNVYGLDAKTGAQKWVKPQLDPHPLGGVIGNSLVRMGDTVVVAFSALEDSALLLPQLGIPYQCCSHTGLVVALDLKTGKEVWRFDTVKPTDVQALAAAFAPFKLGPSGADIWGTPSFDPVSNTVFIGTGQNFSPKPTGGGTSTSDAIIALNASTGQPRWITQVTPNDIWVGGIPSPDANGVWSDKDFGDSPKIYFLNGRKVVGAGTKGGIYYVLDARTGEVIKSTEIFKQANQLGGIQNGGAYGRDKVFVHGLDNLDTPNNAGPFNGSVVALSPDGTKVKWRFDRFRQLLVSPLALAGELLYFVSPVEEAQPGVDPFQFALYALDADTGEVAKRIAFPGRAISAPVVARGHVYVVSGNSAVARVGADNEGKIISLGLDHGNCHDDEL